MRSTQLIHAFSSLGQHFISGSPALEAAKRQAAQHNPWFAEQQVSFALQTWAKSLEAAAVETWLAQYASHKPVSSAKRVGIIMAGNIPLVGLHDLLCVLAAGHIAVVKPSSDDKILMEYVIRFLGETEPELKTRVEITERLNDIDAVIATGSNNTNRYFEYYFGKYPHLLRGSRTSVAVLKGDESKAELEQLGEDIFRYFGLGCRNVSKIFVPQNYDLAGFFEAIFPFAWAADHNKYLNNHNYYHAIYLMNQIPFLDNNFLIVKEDSGLHSPVAVLFYERYTDVESLHEQLKMLKSDLQCVVARPGFIANAIPFGQAQQPSLGDYADGVDTMKFLLSLS